MAYQPIPGPMDGHLSELSTDDTPVTLASAGTEYVVLAVQLKPGLASSFAVPLQSISVMAGKLRDVQWRAVLAPAIAGTPLVFTDLDPKSVLQGAVGDGTQTISGGTTLATGGFVPAGSERGKSRQTVLNAPLGPVDSGIAAVLVAFGMGNNGSVSARAEYLEIPLKENDTPEGRGFPTGV